MKRSLAFLFVASLALAQPPPDVLKFFQTAAENLADADEQAFVNHFDPNMPGFAALRENIQTLLAAREVASAIEVVTDEGDSTQRQLQLDWVLSTTEKIPLGQSRTRRVIVKCKIERQGKHWKITAFQPLDFFKL